VAGEDREVPALVTAYRKVLPPGALSKGRTNARTDGEAIRADLLVNAIHYDFFHAVGMMERLHPGAIRVGGSGPYPGDAIRFRHDSSLAFRSGDISKVLYVDRPRSRERTVDATAQRFDVTTSFLGLTGGVTPLPLYMAEEIVQGEDTDPVQRDFLDIFHHRFISFVYRIGVKHDLAREYTADATDAWSRRVLALAGFDVWGPHHPRFLPMWQLLRLAPLFANRSRGARTLEVALMDVCAEALDGATVRVEQFAGEWSPLDAQQRMMLGTRNHALGVASVLGVQCYDKAARAVIVIGMLGRNFQRFLADGDMFPKLVEIVALLSREPVEYELSLRIADRSRPPFRLGTKGGSRVGIDAWLSSDSGAQGATTLRVPVPHALPETFGKTASVSSPRP